jgi:hypothetical protein
LPYDVRNTLFHENNENKSHRHSSVLKPDALICTETNPEENKSSYDCIDFVTINTFEELHEEIPFNNS